MIKKIYPKSSNKSHCTLHICFNDILDVDSEKIGVGTSAFGRKFIMAVSKGGIEPIVYPVPEFFNTQEAPHAAHVGLNFIALPSWGIFLPRDVAPHRGPRGPGPSVPSECSTVDTEQRGDLQVQKPWSTASMTTLLNVFNSMMDAALSCHRPQSLTVTPARRSGHASASGLHSVSVVRAN
eukprot:s878_g3.t1